MDSPSQPSDIEAMLQRRNRLDNIINKIEWNLARARAVVDRTERPDETPAEPAQVIRFPRLRS